MFGSLATSHSISFAPASPPFSHEGLCLVGDDDGRLLSTAWVSGHHHGNEAQPESVHALQSSEYRIFQGPFFWNKPSYRVLQSVDNPYKLLPRGDTVLDKTKMSRNRGHVSLRLTNSVSISSLFSCLTVVNSYIQLPLGSWCSRFRPGSINKKLTSSVNVNVKQM